MMYRYVLMLIIAKRDVKTDSIRRFPPLVFNAASSLIMLVIDGILSFHSKANAPTTIEYARTQNAIE